MAISFYLVFVVQQSDYAIFGCGKYVFIYKGSHS